MEQLIPFDYSTLRVIWWVLLGLLIIGFAVMDGFDLGVATLLPFIGKTDEERRILLNLVGPVWEGNQVWLITAGAAIFAVWPAIYASAFSTFYFALLLALAALIIRPVGFKYRSKRISEKWRGVWDGLLSLSGFVSTLVFGVAVGNVLLGVRFGMEEESLRPLYHGDFWALFTPFALLCGVLAVAMFVMHGGILAAWRTLNPISDRARKWACVAAVLVVVLFSAGGFYVQHIPGYLVTSVIDINGASNPLSKTVVQQPGAWLSNFQNHPDLWLIPAVAILSSIGVLGASLMRRYGMAFIFSSLSIAGIIFTVGVAMFPFLLPSSVQPNASLLVWDASSSRMTLWITLLAVSFFLPIIIAYTTWIYHVMRGVVTAKNLDETPNSY